ncbi:MAG: hypothetical protein EB117_14625 [Betaproteobacteria bacterium]|nr:hypothetical protein [Betaproteobacteria bacterium]
MEARTATKPYRLGLAASAAALDVSLSNLVVLIERGVFTTLQDTPRGKRFIPTDELELYATAPGSPEQRAERLREYRRERGRL